MKYIIYKYILKLYYTDSLYLALSADSLDKVIKPGMWDEWVIARKKWFPRTDTPENAAYDRRTPCEFAINHSQFRIL